ncbi:hypothetical protein PQ472_10060 [Lacticaseibacillus pabuli]|jgi:hypothetical protein|uniref:Uncharacterized protein n=1 Tax=Lacticaseibacillus pabuli TaxID=3025672 RepID=A0ABY7WT92_9LACO|nr:hypothetical protein [Lacticaseibacillus sp. KACC 23028]WDF82222.1 hypothetical protein PQ472_10060 [Lacticaseibacillus sp. KACC 23028]
MVVGKDKFRRQFTLTPATATEIKLICQSTGEASSELIRRLIECEAMLIRRGFVTHKAQGRGRQHA